MQDEKRQSQVRVAIVELQKVKEELTNAVNNLRDRLSIVLVIVPECPVNETLDKPTETQVDLAKELQIIKENCLTEVSKIRGITDRLEL